MNIRKEYIFRYEYVLEGIKTLLLVNLCGSEHKACFIPCWMQQLENSSVKLSFCGIIFSDHYWHFLLVYSSSRKLDLGLKIGCSEKQLEQYKCKDVSWIIWMGADNLDESLLLRLLNMYTLFYLEAQ